MTLLLLAIALASPPLASNTRWSVLPAPTGPGGARATLQAASWQLVDGPDIELAGVSLSADRIARWAATPPWVDLQSAIRDDTGRAVDLDDMMLWLDDIVASGRTEPVYATPGRARAAGILLHPDDVFEDKSRDYGRRPMATDRPVTQRLVPPADDADPLGVRWTTRYANPSSAHDQLQALLAERPDSDFAERIASLTAQLQAQGAQVWITSGARDPRRGYLLWGSFVMSQQTSAAGVRATAQRLDRARREWELEVPIVWQHPEGWAATVAAARRMAETYDVVYATQWGAQFSNHYGGFAVDLVALDLPVQLTLAGPDKASASFDLSGPDHSRDLSLQVELIEWIEEHFRLIKLHSDYPHWTDADAPPD